MKNRVFILSFLISMISVNFVFAQTSTKKLSYQAVVRNAANELVVNQNLSVEITILNAENAPQYKETHPSVPTSQNGLLWLWVGEGNPTLGTMEDVVWKDATIRSVFTLPDGSTVTQNTPVTAMPHAFFADEVDTVFLQNYLDTHDVVPDNYVTHPQLNDTLGHYYTNSEVNAILNAYTTNTHLNDTLSHYLMQEVQVLSISHDTIFLTGGSFVKLPAGFSGSYHDLVDTPTNVSAFNNDAGYLTSYTEQQMLSISNDTIFLTGGSFVKLPEGFSGSYHDLVDTPENVSAFTNDAGYLTEHQSLEDYVTNDKLNDTLNAYYDTTHIKQTLKQYLKTGELCDSIVKCEVVKNMRDSLHNAFDTLKYYTTSNEIDTLLGAYYDTTHTKSVISDTATALRAMMGDAANDGIITIDVSGGTIENPTFSVNQANNQTVKITIPETIPAEDGQLTIIAAGDTTRFTANQATNDTVRLNKFATKDTLAAYYDTADVKQMLKPYLKANELCDSIVKCDVIKDMRDSIRDNAAAIQTNATNIQTNATNIGFNKQAIIDSSAHIRNDIKNGQITIAVNRSTATTETTVTNPTFGVNQGTDQTVTINIPQETTVNNGQLTIIAAGDTTRFTANQATNDTMRLDKFATKEALKDTAKTLRGIICDSATACITKALADPTSEINYAIDTIARHHVSDSTRMVFDTLHKYYATKDTLKNFVNKLAIRDSVNKIVTDSLRKGPSEMTRAIDSIARHHVSDSTRMVFDTLHKYYATKDTLKNFVNKLAIRDSVNNIVKDSLAAPNSAINIAVDTIARHNISDSTRMVFDTLHLYYATKKALKDTASAIRGDICDSATACIAKALANANSEINHAVDTITRYNIHDTATAIRNSIGNGQITITRNDATITNGSFNLNQKTGQTINIAVPTQTSELTNNSNLAYTTGNTFSGAHDFTASGTTITVPSNTDAIKRPIPTTSPASECTNMNAVNVCDLLAVFDSLSRRIDTLQKQLNELKSATPPTVSVSLSDATYTSMKATASASGNGANVTSYKFCISTNSDMSGANCFTSTSNEYTFTGLNANTLYYVTADATNMVGTTTSAVVSKRTAIHAPSGSFTLESIAPTGFKVMISSLDFKEPAAGTVQICYKKNDGSCPSNFADYTTCDEVLNLTSSVTDTTRKFINVDEEAGIEYCVIVKITNGDSTTILDPLTINTGAAISLDIATTNATPNLCGGTVDVTFTATPNPTSIDVDDFENYTWSEGTGTGNSTTVTYSTSGTKTITCTATHKTEGYTITGNSSFEVINTGDGPTFTFCVDSLTVNITSISSGTTNLSWGDNSADESNPSTSSYNNYATDGVYSIVATNSSGCSTTKQAAVGIATLHPCTVTSIKANEQGSGTTINTLQDVDGNLYAVVQIGKQCWMKSNLRTTHYSDGTEIANGTGSGADNTTSHTTAYYYRPVASSNFDGSYDFSKYNFKTDGLYYNWKATMHGAAGSSAVPSRVQGVCPTGWHVPSVREWDTLFAFVQTLPNATYWDLHPIGYAHAIAGGCEWVPEIDGLPGYYQAPAWNISEFSMVPAGEVANSFKYNVKYEPYASPQEAAFWTSKEADVFANSPQAWTYAFYAGEKSARLGKSYSSQGSSVRCVRDYESGSPISDPYVTTENATNVDYTTATLNGSVVNPDNQNVTSKGFEWKLSTATDYTSSVTVTDGAFTHNLSGLTEGTSYTYRAFITHSGWTVYGEEVTFMTLIDPTVETNEATSVTYTSASLNGTITNPSNFPISPKGFEWKLSTATDFTTETVTGEDLTYNLTGLSDGKKYVYKAFITFNNVIVYGEVDTLKTTKEPEVATDVATSIGENTAVLNGTITNPDNVPISSKGFEWRHGTDDFTPVTVTTDDLTLNLSGLTSGTEYEYKAFITFDNRTEYGEVQTFTTAVPAPTLSVISDKSSPTVCKNGSNYGSTVVTYSASVDLGGVPQSGYSFSWSVPSNMQYIANGNTCTVIYTSASNYTVSCTGTPVSGDPVVGSLALTVSSVSGTLPTFRTCEDDGSLSVEIKSSSNVASYDWGDNTTSTDNDHLYSSDGVYIVSAINGSCTATKMISVGVATTRPCTVTSHHTDNTVYTTSSGGLETENSEGKVVSVKDQDGNSYAVTQIGSQCWMKTNLRTTTFSDGFPIPNGTKTGGTNHILNNSAAYLYKPIPNASHYDSYNLDHYNEFKNGLYYNWTAAMDSASSSTTDIIQGVCPKGWHLPSDNEWQAMSDAAQTEAYPLGFMGGEQRAVLLSGSCEWSNASSYKPGYYSDQLRNYVGFTAIPAGHVRQKLEAKDTEVAFWSTCQKNDTNAYYWVISDGSYSFKKSSTNEKKYGYSVRCVRDAE